MRMNRRELATGALSLAAGTAFSSLAAAEDGFAPFEGIEEFAVATAKDRVLAPDEIRVLWRALDEGDGPVSTALRFLLLTGLRPGEVAGLEIGEVADIDNSARARLEIATARMKGGKAHIVPLAPMALQIVRAELGRAQEGQTHVFASAFVERGPIARHSLSQGLKRIIAGLEASRAIERLKADPPTPHDFRRTLATGLAALGLPREDRLAVLAHAQDDVHAAHYDRYDRLAEKRRALEAWEAHVADLIGPAPAKTADNVVRIARARR